MSSDLMSALEPVWKESVLPVLNEYIAIPALSPDFDPRWAETGHLDRAMDLLRRWALGRKIPGLAGEIVRLEGRTPLLVLEVPGDSAETVLLYGHMDKQPAMTGWNDGLGPWTPVYRDGKLYGRGGGDDGYAIFSAITALEALAAAGTPHARALVLIEASEESGSPDLPAYVDHLAGRIGTPDLVVCLDSGAGDYDRLWATASLRGIASGTLRVEILKEGVHSGSASGIVPSSFRIARALLSRIEDEATGKMLPPELHVPIPANRMEEAKRVAAILGEKVYRDFPLLPGMRPVTADLTELVLNNTWRPALAVTGAGGFPPVAEAGNVTRPVTSLKLSIRIPPGVDSARANARLKEILEADPPYGARVSFETETPGNGWSAPAFSPWLEKSLDRASREIFGQPPGILGEGGSIPFMAMLGEKFPKAQFLITGVLGPGSNAHGPNEFLHVPFAIKLTACVARVLADHRRAGDGGS